LSQQSYAGFEGHLLDNLTSGAFGFGVEWYPERTVGLLTDLRILTKGASFDHVPSGPSEVRANYLSASVLLRVAKQPTEIPAGFMYLYAAAGPRVDFLIGSGPDTDLDWFPGGFDRLDLGADVAVGAALVVFLFEARYSPSFTRAYHRDGLEVRNSAWVLSGGVRF